MSLNSKNTGEIKIVSIYLDSQMHFNPTKMIKCFSSIGKIRYIMEIVWKIKPTVKVCVDTWVHSRLPKHSLLTLAIQQNYHISCLFGIYLNQTLDYKWPRMDANQCLMQVWQSIPTMFLDIFLSYLILSQIYF